MKKLKVLVMVAIVALLNEFSNAETESQSGYSADYLNLVAVEKSLLIKHLNEGVEHKEIFNIKYNDCEFFIVEQEPEDREYIKIDRETNMITSIALDREDKAFSKMLVPQIQVELRLDCPHAFIYHRNNNTTLQRSYINNSINKHFPNRLGDRSYVLTRDINFSPLTMMLTIIIEDENDSLPHFIYPPSSNFLIGYPDATVSEDLLPDYLLKVSAVDRDDGLNAKIKYKISMNDHFDINPETGEIYPFENALWDTEQVNLTVYAADRNGAEDAKVSSLNIRVRKVCTDHLVVLTIEKENAFEAEKTLELIKHKTGMNFNVLKQGFMLKHPKSNSKLLEQSARKVVLRAWIYGFDSDEELLESSLMEAKVSEIGKEISVSVVSHAKTKNKTDDQHNSNNNNSDTIITFVIVIVLLLIIIIVLIVSFLCWYCICFRKYRKMETPSNSTATTISSISIDAENQRHSVEDNHGNPFRTSTFHKRDSHIKTRENLRHSSNFHSRNSILKGRSSLPEQSEINRFAQKLHHILGDISELQGSTVDLDQHRISPERRKSSVTFNDNIEFFNIYDDDDDEDSVNNVRL